MMPLLSDSFGPRYLRGLSGFESFNRLGDLGFEHSQTPVSNFVNQRLLSKLVEEFKIPENAAAKALYYSGNNDLDKAIDWVERNQDSEEFNNMLKISRPERFSDHFDDHRNYSEKRMITKELKMFKDRYENYLDKWKDKLYSEGEVQQISTLTEYLDEEESLDDLLKKKETGEWRKEEVRMMKKFIHKTKLPQFKLTLQLAMKPKKEQKKEVIREEAKEKKKEQKPNYLSQLFKHFREKKPKAKEDVNASEDERWGRYLEYEDKVEQEKRNEVERYHDRNNSLPDDKKIRNYLEYIYGYGKDYYTRSFEVLEKILNGLLNEPDKYKVLLRSDEDTKNNVFSVEEVVRLLKVVGYNPVSYTHLTLPTICSV
eukprot:TRINITY_DN13540_c0_g1_i1.p1 TRINITY_DN13540_c0_g1~~TRINITY_DN13540_c0_g1_i1.p1  ORF type:complete len:370 (+),score=141.44 TRINITY_DN13540_c0_g1_i1:212-1321(+)